VLSHVVAVVAREHDDRVLREACCVERVEHAAHLGIEKTDARRVGLPGLPALLVLSRKTLDIPNTQSATGILYVACLAAIVGELTAQLLGAGA